MIDAGLVHPWPQPVLDALERFQQGDVIAEPLAVFAGDARYALWDPSAGTGEAEVGAGSETQPQGRNGSSRQHGDRANPVAEPHAEADEGKPQIELVGLDPAPPFGIITTQTCDLNEQRGQKLQPFFQVAPVYAVAAGQRDAILRRENIVPILSPTASDDETQWVADLRIEFPLEKSVLAHRQPIRVFADEAEQISFAERLGARRARPALANELHDVIAASINKKRSNNKSRSRPVFAQIYKVSLAIEEGVRMRPVRVRVVVVCREEPSEQVREWFGSWYDTARDRAEAAGITLHATGFRDARCFDLIRDAHLVDLLVP